jgi:hypothetical protein
LVPTTKHADFSSKIKAMKINSMIVEIDGIDKNFEVLMEDARKPILQIANKIDFRSCYPSKVAKTRSPV